MAPYPCPTLPMCVCVCVRVRVFAEAADLCTSGQLTALAGDAWRNQSSNNEQNQPLTW